MMGNTRLVRIGRRLTNMKTILLDADMLVYRAAFASETETKWDEDTWSLTCKESDMKREVITFM